MADAKRSKKRSFEENLALIKARSKKRIEAAAVPGESFAETEIRLRAEDVNKERESIQEKGQALAAVKAAKAPSSSSSALSTAV